MKICTKCKQTKSYDNFYTNRTKKGDGYQYYCIPCKKATASVDYYKNSERIKRNINKFKQRNREKLFDYLSNKRCTDCDESDSMVLEFDHTMNNKFKNIARLISGWKWETVLHEINKCEIVCANCHKRRTYKRMKHCYRIDLGKKIYGTLLQS